MTQYPTDKNAQLFNQIQDFCKHIAGPAQVTAISLFANYSMEPSSIKAPLEIMLVIHDFQPRLMSYVKIVNGRNLIVLAVDQWVFERDVERGFLGEALASVLIFPYTALYGTDYLHSNEIKLKKRLILELVGELGSQLS